MDTVALLGKVIDNTGNLVEGLSDDQLDTQTPCTEWKVRDLLNHLVGGATMFAASAEHGSVPDDELATIMGDNLGDDYKGAWRQASSRAVAAFQLPGVMDKTVKLPFGEMPASVALNIAVLDVSVHACDLAKATGQPAPPDEILEPALEMGKQMIGADFRKPGIFDEEQPAAADAPLADRILAFAGRRI